MVRPDGPVPARIMLIGEAPGEQEEREGTPFVGPSGKELNQMLQEVGLMRSECYVTNVCKIRPPNNFLGNFIALTKKARTPAHLPLRDKWVLPPIVEGYKMLQQEIADVKPLAIVAYGNLALWALTGRWGITKWRGSMLALSLDAHKPCPYAGHGPLVVPTYHPAAILRQWDWRAAGLNDLKRAKRHLDGKTPPLPAWRFTLRPSFTEVVDRLRGLWEEAQRRVCAAEGPLWLDFDIETRAGHIACAGIGWSMTEAICIPFMCVENKDGFWPVEEEAHIVWWLYRLLTHPHVYVRWQNGLYDAQYTWAHWHFVPNGKQDTMISQHTLFGDMPKALAFQASMYCDHYVYWKDEGKKWDKSMREDDLWAYNCEDDVRTREVGEVEQATLDYFSTGPWPKAAEVHRFQQELFWPVLQAMQHGLRVDTAARNELAMELNSEIAIREQFFIDVLGHPLNPQSPDQMHKLFYEDLQIRPILKRVQDKQTGRWEMRPTLDDDALTKIADRDPLFRPICHAVQDHRSLNVLLSTFVLAKTDRDGRMRSSFNIGGSESGKSAPRTYRLSSSENAFDRGANLQNIPSDKSKAVGKAKRREALSKGSVLAMAFTFPNVRRLYIPDPGFTFFDMDLDRADLQTVVWESGEPDFIAAMRMGVDLHLWNAYVLQSKSPPALEELIEGKHPNYPEHRARMKYAREFAKVFCHGTNYGGGAKTMAMHCGVSVFEADRAQKIWFGAHPGIKRWHDRMENMLYCRGEYSNRKSPYIENQFGYRWYIFDRPDGLLPEVLAWLPQSHTACVINRIWMNFYKNLPAVDVLLQVHDSLAGQFPTHLKDSLLPRMREESKIVIPYPDPLIIPTGLKTSEKSWGECV